MSTAEKIFERAKKLPEPLQSEALQYLEFLASRQADREQAEWSSLSAAQLEPYYSPDDAIYDKD